MDAAMNERAPEADVIIMAAAVADYRPADVADSKMKKGSADEELATLRLVENPDILKGLVARRDAGELKDGVVIAGFAAETGDATHSALDFARAKFERKGCDVLMANEVGVGKVFGQTTNSGWILRRGAEPTVVELGSKQVVAAQILDAVNAIASE